MSDAQFVAARPGQRPRRPGPPHAAGDQGRPARLPDHQRRPGGRGVSRRTSRFARQMLDEELGDDAALVLRARQPRGDGRRRSTTSRPSSAPPHRIFDHQGTRFSRSTLVHRALRGGGFDQIGRCASQLDAAAGDPAVGSVVRDPARTRRATRRPARASQLGDRKEAALLEDWLADFQRTHRQGRRVRRRARRHLPRRPGGRGAVPRSTATRARTRPPPPDQGGFTGWSCSGVDPVTPGRGRPARRDPLVEGPRWVAASSTRTSTRSRWPPRPASRSARRRRPPPRDQPGGRTVPVAAPVSADWSASPRRAHRLDSRAEALARGPLRPGHRRLTALRARRAGQAGRRGQRRPAEATVTLTAATAAPPPEVSEGPFLMPGAQEGALPATSEVALGHLEDGQAEGSPHPDHLLAVVEDADHPAPVPDLPRRRSPA